MTYIDMSGQGNVCWTRFVMSVLGIGVGTSINVSVL